MSVENVFPRRTRVDEFLPRSLPLQDGELQATVRDIVTHVREEGEEGLRRLVNRYDGGTAGGHRPAGAGSPLDPASVRRNSAGPGPRSEFPLYLDRDRLKEAFDGLSTDDSQHLERIAGRIEAFASAQKESLKPLRFAVPGGSAGHRVTPVTSAGCYVPGGRYPLPSSALMTVIPARVAGVETIWIASPQPSDMLLAAAWIAGADGVLAAGGAHAIAALGMGVGPIPACDVIAGPGNRYVTEAKRQLSGTVRIDMLAGPSELVVIADETADPSTVAADLIAQAEHDPDALPVLLALGANVRDAIERKLIEQLADLPTAKIARASLGNGGSIIVESREKAAASCDRLAPEHVQVCCDRPRELADRLRDYGAVFVGSTSAEVFGDYGAGPNHTLPTHGSARTTAGLSVYTFLRIQTWLELEERTVPLSAAERPDAVSTDKRSASGPDEDFHVLIQDSVWLARQEGLEGHARAAEKRMEGDRNN